MESNLTPEEKAIWEQIFELKELTKRTGILHDAQIKQMHLWVSLVAGGKYTLEIDVDNKKIYIRYKLKCTEKNIKNRGLWLDKSIKLLLGDDWNIKLYFKNIKKYG